MDDNALLVIFLSRQKVDEYVDEEEEVDCVINGETDSGFIVDKACLEDHVGGSVDEQHDHNSIPK